MSVEVRVDKALLTEVVQSKVQNYRYWIEKEMKADLSSSCDIVWRLDGLPQELTIQSNMLAALCLAFHGAQSEGWSLAIGDILSLPGSGELAIEEPRLDAVGDHLNILNNAFGTSEPDPDDEESLEVLEEFIKVQLVSDIWHAYGHKLSELDAGFCAPLFCVSEGTELHASITAAVADPIEDLMKAVH